MTDGLVRIRILGRPGSGTVIDGKEVLAGEEVDVSPRTAFAFVEGYKQAAYVTEPPPAPRPGMTTADVTMQVRDPIAPKKGK